eukprot:TRINITY_DN5624_c0_g1_i1.p1 TRINITY_DN5624_c0_g1~~TRINITY_DN5624_c0_g1_i1.p1  ORF type:complete len:460 (+),score=50.51 TRINITY_DN5624_c0_g1_i1:107-1486(+)
MARQNKQTIEKEIYFFSLPPEDSVLFGDRMLFTPEETAFLCRETKGATVKISITKPKGVISNYRINTRFIRNELPRSHQTALANKLRNFKTRAWACSVCTAENAGKHLQCQVCGRDRLDMIFSALSPNESPQQAPAEAIIYWHCAVCTFHNTQPSHESKCEMCGSDRPEISNEPDQKHEPEEDEKARGDEPAANVHDEDKEDLGKEDPDLADIDPHPVSDQSIPLLDSHRPTVLCLHGFGLPCTWATWLKMALPLHQAGFQMIFVDLPGFGKSSGRDMQSGVWRSDGPSILTSILDAYQIKSPVSVLAHCGGAATFMRTFILHPKRFAGCHHVFHNNVISEWPVGLDAAFEREKCQVLVTWCEDSEHMRWCVSYKHMHQLRLAKTKYLQFLDINPQVLAETGANVEGWGRKNVNSAYVFGPSVPYVHHAVSHFLKACVPALKEAFCAAEKLRAMDVLRD